MTIKKTFEMSQVLNSLALLQVYIEAEILTDDSHKGAPQRYVSFIKVSVWDSSLDMDLIPLHVITDMEEAILAEADRRKPSTTPSAKEMALEAAERQQQEQAEQMQIEAELNQEQGWYGHK